MLNLARKRRFLTGAAQNRKKTTARCVFPVFPSIMRFRTFWKTLATIATVGSFLSAALRWYHEQQDADLRRRTA